jgi:hypothetical protein
MRDAELARHLAQAQALDAALGNDIPDRKDACLLQVAWRD